MIRKLIPLIVMLVGLGVGLVAGVVVRPSPDAETADGAQVAADHHEMVRDPAAVPDYVKLSNQFIVPILEEGRVVSMVIVSLSLEVTQGSTDNVHAREPKLRDALLQVLFDHANAGGFRGSFTDAANLVVLRRALLEMAVTTLGEMVTDVLIVDIVRQDT